MRLLIGRYVLKNPHAVYRSEAGFVVVQTDAKGVEYSVEVNTETADHLFAVCRNETVSSEEAALRLAPYARRLALPYEFGYKLKFYVQEVLLVLVATGRAGMSKRGRRFLYSIE